MPSPLPYSVQVTNVREVTLLGTADLSYWQDQLAPHDLLPVPSEEGQAQLLISSVAARFMGLAFCELSLSVLASDAATSEAGAYLFHAYNSRRCFAFVERNLFSTPYFPAKLDVSAAPQPSFAVTTARGGKLSVVLARPARPALRTGDEGWEGPLFLPSGKLFYGRIRGETQAFAFDASYDKLVIEPQAGDDALQRLIDANFVPREWQIRLSATHGKTKTAPRPLAGGAQAQKRGASR